MMHQVGHCKPNQDSKALQWRDTKKSGKQTRIKEMRAPRISRKRELRKTGLSPGRRTKGHMENNIYCLTRQQKRQIYRGAQEVSINDDTTDAVSLSQATETLE